MAIKRTSACLVSCLKLVFLEVWISMHTWTLDSLYGDSLARLNREVC